MSETGWMFFAVAVIFLVFDAGWKYVKDEKVKDLERRINDLESRVRVTDLMEYTR